MHVGVLGWRAEGLLRNMKSTQKAFGKSRLIICCQQKDIKRVSEAVDGALVFSPEGAEGVFPKGDSERNGSIGHARNLILLSSIAIGRQENIVLLDDDISPDDKTAKAFDSAFSKYDLVQGNYVGSSGNGIYSLVYFFDLLSDQDRPDFERLVKNAVCGAVPSPKKAPSVAGLAGGLAGLSAAIKAKNCFASFNDYSFDDHFYEFSTRYIFPEGRFMGHSTAESDIPVALHDAENGKPGKLVDNFVRHVRSAIVESYFYFRLSGCLPRIVGGKHALVRTGEFDPNAVAKEILASAVEKFRMAAQSHVPRFEADPELQKQLLRIASLHDDDFFVPQDALSREWDEFEAERAWFFEACRKCEKEGSGISERLLSGR